MSENPLSSTAIAASAWPFANRWRCTALLLVLQVVVAAVIYRDFLTGRSYFAFGDIGSDTYTQFIPTAMHLADYLVSEGLPGWSFQIGLGGTLGVLTDPFLLLSTLFGPDAVPGVRIWIHLLKIACGGAFFLHALLALDVRREAALVTALAYSFCGYLLIDGQWDPHASEYVFYTLILWAVIHHRRHGGILFLPLAIAATAASGIFMFSVGFFLACLFAADLVVGKARGRVAGDWFRRTWPLALLGLLLAGPFIVPNTLHLLDSPRVTGAQAMFAERLRELVSTNDLRTIYAQLAGLWHKDIVGIGSDYRGWMNYLEGPGFYVGVLPLLLIPQLWRGDRQDRIALVAGLATVAFYIVSPFLRYATFAFGQYYFRVSTLWIAMLLLVLAARALTIVFERGVDRRLLATAAVVALTLLAAVIAYYKAMVRLDHVFKLLALLLVAAAGLTLQSWKKLAASVLATAMMIFVAVESMLVGWPGVNDGRLTVTPANFGYADATIGALRLIRNLDAGFYRVEKTYESAALCDALAQSYFGTKSYWFHGSGVVAFHIGLGLIPPRHAISNFTNWLPGPGDRFALHSLLGVKYMISTVPLHWPGFRPIAANGNLTIYRNDTALPLGIVQNTQYPRERFAQLPPAAKDLMIINTAIVERPLDGIRFHDEREILGAGADRIDRFLAQPAWRHQLTGMQIEHFSQQRISGRLPAGDGGILVFSIPDAPGWSIRIDGIETPSFRANLGMLAVRVEPGAHGVELSYRQPGRGIGLAVAAIAAVLLALAGWRAARGRGPAGVGA